MAGETKKRKRKGVSDSSQKEKSPKKQCSKGVKLKPKLQVKSGNSESKHMKKCFDRLGEGKGNISRRKSIVKKAIMQKTKSLKKQSELKTSRKDEPEVKNSKDGGKRDSSDVGLQKVKRRKRRKRRKENLELDEASRLQRRTRYLLIKVKLEQNLIDAYSAEGWKGHSREKIKPEKELERAKKQILKCKLGIREAICQLDGLSSVGHIEDSAVAPDGSVHHEHIICAKCKLREAFPDNDIVLCDGTCNCAFHQKCLDPPLSTENIPPGDEGWFCRYCKSKMEILEVTNAHLGTNFPLDSNWQDIFKEEAALLDGKESLLCPEEEWPSDDSEDVDYDPEGREFHSPNSMSGSGSDSSVDASSSNSLSSIEDDVLLLSERLDKRHMVSEGNIAGVESDEATDCEVLSGPRQRKAVDYIKLHDEMFGKNAVVSEQISEDEDWGPSRRKHRGKESNVESIVVTTGDNPGTSAEVKKKLSSGRSKRPIFRFPRHVVEKLRVVFAENELPSRTIRDNLSRQLGLESEKVNKWFKNARYLALKARKKAKRLNASGPTVSKESVSRSGEDKSADPVTSENVAIEHELESPGLKSSSRRKTAHLMASAFTRKRHKTALPPTNNKTPADFGDDVCLKLLREKVKKKKKMNIKRTVMLEAEAEMERLCKMKDKIEKLQQVLLGLPSSRSSKADAAALNELAIIYVPVAELREKR
ncbi:pathogenesis-related homeodomain protein [Coffea arabica]|uniref:Pathogenesis-related homeodomain protein n=1 Tax=Coffea arabica TaxID=13443 RepID=A0A6P6T3H5_COFAR|nr:pathogenesis-related homeodomain protein-like [Coffea arabica]